MKIIKNYQDALNIQQQLSSFQTNGWHFFYRGHASKDFKLIPTVGRKNPMSDNMVDSEKSCLKEFMNLVQVENWLRFKVNSYDTKLFYMSIGRHLGLDCRLLDWSASLDTALYFASSDINYTTNDGDLWIMCYKGEISSHNADKDPFKAENILLIKEDYLLPAYESIKDQPLGILRRFRQNGYFTIMPANLIKIPLEKLSNESMQFIRITIDSNAKKEIISKVPRSREWLYLSEKSRIADDIKEINAKYFK